MRDAWRPAVYVVGVGSISPLGASSTQAFEGYASGAIGVRARSIGGRVVPVGALCSAGQERLRTLGSQRAGCARLDRAVRLAVLAAREARPRAASWDERGPAGVLLASSRGATETLEARHAEFLASGRTHVLTSPTTTLGNLSSSVARELALDGFVAELSSACTGSLQAFVLAVAWLRAGFGAVCLAGGAEAPLTPFTLAQLDALGLLAQSRPRGPACRPLALEAKSGLVLAEGACVLALESSSSTRARSAGALAEVAGVGTCVERAPSPAGISARGAALTGAMQRALAQHGERVDAVVVHAPGTAHGDGAELVALRSVFGPSLPPLCSAKWQMGHTFGAAGAFGLELALALLGGLRPACPPYASELRPPHGPVRSVLVNAAGFGGTAASVVLRRVSRS